MVFFQACNLWTEKIEVMFDSSSTANCDLVDDQVMTRIEQINNF